MTSLNSEDVVRKGSKKNGNCHLLTKDQINIFSSIFHLNDKKFNNIYKTIALAACLYSINPIHPILTTHYKPTPIKTNTFYNSDKHYPQSNTLSDFIVFKSLCYQFAITNKS